MNDEILSLNGYSGSIPAGQATWVGPERRSVGERRRSNLALLKELNPEKYGRAKAQLQKEFGEEDTEQVAAALERVAPSLLENKLRLFFSYKFVNQSTAETVTAALQRFSGNTLEIKIASDFQKGVDYSRKIRDEIEQANWFLLLLPDPSVDWDWCLFETGMFRRGFIRGSHRIICLHHPDVEVPEQISEFNSVPATQEKVESFLKELFLVANAVPGMEPLAPHVTQKDLDDLARVISDAIVPPGNMRKVSRYVVLDVDNARNLKSYKDMYDARVQETDQLTCGIFGKEPGVKTWGEMISNFASRATDRLWLQELFEVLRKAARGDTFWPVQATFEQVRGGKVFRPLLAAAQAPSPQNADNDQAWLFEILFVEEVGSTGVQYVEPRLNALFTSLRLAYRFRWEVIERFGNCDLEENDVTTLENTIRRLETEASSRGILDAELLCENFSEPEVVDQIMDIFGKWGRLRMPDKTGELDMALQNSDLLKISRLLSRLSEMNRRFIKLTTGKLEELSR